MTLFRTAAALALVAGVIACSGGEAPTAAPDMPATQPAAHLAVQPPAPAAETSVFDERGQLKAYDGRFASDPKLSPADVATMDPDQLVLIRNEIFARYGRAFQTPAIREHFEAQPWYHVRGDYSDSVLTANDRANADLIKGFEGEGADPSGVAYAGSPGLSFYGASTVYQVGGEEGGAWYEFIQEEYHWTRRGNYVITWTGPTAFSAADSSIQDAKLWKLDDANKTAQIVGKLVL